MNYYHRLYGIRSTEGTIGLRDQMHTLIDAIHKRKEVNTVEVIADKISLELLLIENREGHEGIKPYKDLFTEIISNYRLSNYKSGVRDCQ